MKKLCVAGIVAALVLALAVPYTGAASGPMAELKTSIDALIEVLKTSGQDVSARREKIRDIIRERFDFRAMSQRALGKNWKKASKEQKDRFVELFSSLLEATYLNRIEAYTDEKVSFKNEKIKKNRAVVDTVIVTKSAEIPITYKMFQKNAWRVYDISIEGVSLVRNFRTSYGEIIDKEGFPSLLKRMEEKVAERAASAGGGT